MNSREAEKQELERAIELLGRTTRPGRLLEYLGAKHFQEHAEQLTEFTLATEVFGRSEKTFDPTSDAVVRVETHRLRKKLREIYEKDSRPQGMQISLPAGTYVPSFTVATAPASTAAASDEPPAPAPAGKRRLVASWSLGLVVVVVIAIGTALMQGRSQPAPTTAAPQSAGTRASATAASGQLTEVHFLAGYSGSEVIDSSGVRWTPDRFNAGGGQWSRDNGFVRRTSRPFMFVKWSQRWSFASRRSSSADAAPCVMLI